MPEDKPSTPEGSRREVRGPPPGELDEELRQAAGGNAPQFDPARGSGSLVTNNPLATPGELTEPKASFEVDESCDCGAVPELAVDKGEVGAWRLQIVYCSECMHRFGSAVTPVSGDEGDESDE